ncbi:MAG: serine/threonine protein kinase [Sandaracinus sp.]|nr:serine/threonine protein kinase [Sandaracinus sp.]MCB9632198.1 serine/threonine protein kinase [Sandaracinus sp.]
MRAPRDPKVGDVIEGYELLSVLAAGETLVFVARRAKDDRRVVLRMPSARGAETSHALVTNEATYGTRVDHPQVVRVVARGSFGEQPFVAREHVSGLSLQTVLDALARRDRRLETPLAGMITIRVARGLAALHSADAPGQRGLLHGDLHPGNILVSASGQVRLADLGSARPLPPTGPTKAPTPRFPAEPYASPEQMDGRPVDERADVFAMAAILVRLLAGHEPPVHRPIAAWAFDVLADEAPPLRRLLCAALDRSPSSRPSSARAFAEALAEAMPAAASWSETDLVRSLRGSPRSEPVVGLRASTPPPPPPEVEEPITAPRQPLPPAGRATEATRPMRPDEVSRRDSVPDADTTARTLLDRALENDPTPTPLPLPSAPVDGISDAPVPLFRFVAFFALLATLALAGAAAWYFTR